MIAAPRPMRPIDIASAAMRVVGIPQGEIVSRSRRPELVRARELIAAAVRTLTDASLPEIGRLMCRYHTSVMVMVRRWMRRPPEDREELLHRVMLETLRPSRARWVVVTRDRSGGSRVRGGHRWHG